MASGIICQACRIEAPTKYVEFHSNIGMLVMRHHRYVKGNLCKRCIHKNFWKATLVNCTVGPWGTISLIVTPIFILGNTIRYLGAIGMPGVPAGAMQPVVTQSVVDRMQPFHTELIGRLNNREPIEAVATDLSRRAGVTPGQVVMYVVALSKRPPVPQQASGGFPVQPVPAAPQRVEPIDALEPIPLEPETEQPASQQPQQSEIGI